MTSNHQPAASRWSKGAGKFKGHFDIPLGAKLTEGLGRRHLCGTIRLPADEDRRTPPGIGQQCPRVPRPQAHVVLEVRELVPPLKPLVALYSSQNAKAPDLGCGAWREWHHSQASSCSSGSGLENDDAARDGSTDN